jgi:hypothetical protein
MSREKFSYIANVKKLPLELVKELNVTTNAENKALEVFREGGGTLNVAEVMVGFYIMFGQVKDRNYVTGLLHRMKKKQQIKPTARKGEYTLERDGEV